MLGELTNKQKMFVTQYLVDFNGKRAAIAAGYAESSAEVSASRLIRLPKVRARILKRQGKRLAKFEITADRVLQEIAKLAFHDPGEFFEADGSLKRVQDMDTDTRMCIAGLEVTELFEGTGDQKHAYGLLKKIKIADKRAALVDLGKHLKLFSDQVEHSGTVGLQLVHSVPQPVRQLEGE